MPELETNVYQGHNNTFSLTVKINNAAIDLVSTGVTRMVINTDSELQIDSDVEGEGANQPFDWATNGDTGIVEFIFGKLSEVILPLGRHYCTLTIFDPAHTDGQVWDTKFFINVLPHKIH